MDDFQTVHIPNPRSVPSGAALPQRRRHGDPSLQYEVALAAPPRIHSNGIVHSLARQRFFDVRLAGGAMPPPCAVGRLSRVDDKAEGVISLAEFLGEIFPRRLD